MTMTTELAMQNTCPDFCERTEHENMDTAESPVFVHATGDHDVHGVLIQISTVTDDKGEEVEDDALSVFINQQQFSLKEAWDIGFALMGVVNQAELSDPYVRRCLDESGPSTTVRIGRIFREENHEKHTQLRATRGGR